MTQSETLAEVEKYAKERLHPSWTNPNYLVLARRRRIFAKWIADRTAGSMRVLDVGGRIQPYRPLLGSQVQQYVALDLSQSPLVNVCGTAAALPFPDNMFDVVICTQVFEYLADPAGAAAEIHRVLKPGGLALLSFAGFYPRAVDEELWRFLPSGLRTILTPFRAVEIVAEGSSITGFFRATAVCLAMFARYSWLRTIVSWTLVPAINLAGVALENVASTTNDQATGNYSVRAEK